MRTLGRESVKNVREHVVEDDREFARRQRVEDDDLVETLIVFLRK